LNKSLEKITVELRHRKMFLFNAAYGSDELAGYYNINFITF